MSRSLLKCNPCITCRYPSNVLLIAAEHVPVPPEQVPVVAQHRGRHRTPLLAGPGPVHAGRGAETWSGYIFISNIYLYLCIFTDLYAASDSTEGCCHGCLLVLRLAVLEAGELVVVVGELAGLGRHQGVQVRSLAISSYNDDNHGNDQF